MGIPDPTTYELLAEFDDKYTAQLNDVDGYLNVGRETGLGNRRIYFACKEMREPFRVLHAQGIAYADRLDVGYALIKDK